MQKVFRKNIETTEINAIVERLIQSENDRESAILAGAFLEGLLYDLLKENIIDSPLQPAKGLFDSYKPLGSFGNMISLSLAFGFISEEEYVHLNVIKRIRNDAAHSSEILDGKVFSFDSEEIQNILKKIHLPKELDMVSKALRKNADDALEVLLGAQGGKFTFRLIFCNAILLLFSRIKTTIPLKIPNGLNKCDDEKSPD